jgi:hypothetical protein
MLDENMRVAMNQLIDRTTVSFHTIMSSLRTDKADFDIQNESDYAIGLAHGMILTGFMSDKTRSIYFITSNKSHS